MSHAVAQSPRLIILNEHSAYARGRQRGRTCAPEIRGAWAFYEKLFGIHEIAEGDIQREALRSLEATAQWAPYLADEIRGTAAGAEMAEWQVAALNARTEILSMSTLARPGECSTIINTRGAAFSAQTWDWHEELAPFWHLQKVATPSGGFAGLTEYGILAKVGMNHAGVGVHLNVLGHRQDEPGHVPVHVAIAHVLYTATSLDEAVGLLLDAPVRTSSAVSIVTENGAASVELSPLGPAVIRPDDHYLLHTNHFLDEELARGDRTELYQPDSQNRIDLMRHRCAERFQPDEPMDLVPYLHSRPEDGAQLCCVPDPGTPTGFRWATLATAVIRPEDRSIQVSPGTPMMSGPHTWRSLDLRSAMLR